VLVPSSTGSNVPEKSGYLRKKNNMGIYQKRYFTTTNRYLNYFATDKKEALLGSINLTEIIRITDADTSFVFELKAENAGMKLKAKSSKEALEWVQTLRIRWDVIGKGSSAPTSTAPYVSSRAAPALSMIPEANGQFEYQKVLPPPSGPPPLIAQQDPTESRSSLIATFGLTQGAAQRTAQRAMSVLDKNATRRASTKEQRRASTKAQSKVVLPPPSRAPPPSGAPPPVILPPPTLPPPPLTNLRPPPGAGLKEGQQVTRKPQMRMEDGVRILVYDRADCAEDDDDDDDVEVSCKWCESCVCVCTIYCCRCSGCVCTIYCCRCRCLTHLHYLPHI
jgi:hypothetical protein